jgi:hypothetical protein
MESYTQRLTPWMPELVLRSAATGSPMENPDGPFARYVRNLTRAVIEVTSNPNYRPTTK